jgi:hypothetical protein
MNKLKINLNLFYFKMYKFKLPIHVEGDPRPTKKGISLKVHHHKKPNAVLYLSESQVKKLHDNVKGGKLTSRLNFSHRQMSHHGGGSFLSWLKNTASKVWDFVKHPATKPLRDLGFNALKGAVGNNPVASTAIDAVRGYTGLGHKKKHKGKVAGYLR